MVLVEPGVLRVPKMWDELDMGPWGSRCVGSILPIGSKCPIVKVSGPKNPFRIWFLEPETSNIGYLDPLG